MGIKRGSFLFSLGEGYGTTYFYSESSSIFSGPLGSNFIPNVTVSTEVGVAKIGHGALTIRESILFATMPGTYGIGYWGEDYDVGTYTSTGRWYYAIENIGLIYHFGIVGNPHLDPYVGVTASYSYISNTTTTTNTIWGTSTTFTSQYILPTKISAAPYVGFRYLATKHIGVFGEFSYGYNMFTAGASLKF
jgi:hypothetical protein